MRHGRELPDSWGRPELRSGQADSSDRAVRGRFSIEVPVIPGSVVRPGDVLEDITVRLAEDLGESTVEIQFLSDDVLVSSSTLPVSADRETKAHVVVERHDESAQGFTMIVRVGEYMDSVGWIFAPLSDPSNKQNADLGT